MIYKVKFLQSLTKARDIQQRGRITISSLTYSLFLLLFYKCLPSTVSKYISALMLDQFFFYFPPLALNEGPFKLDLTSKLAAPAMAFLFREVAFGATLLKHGQLAVHTHIALLSLTHLLQRYSSSMYVLLQCM